MEINLFYFLLVFIILNSRAYWIMRKDKRRAIYNSENNLGGRGRVSEKSLLRTALFYGFLGIGIGMLPPLRHKKNKLLFKIAIPLITIAMSALTFLTFYFLHTEYQCNIYYDANALFNLW